MWRLSIQITFIIHFFSFISIKKKSSFFIKINKKNIKKCAWKFCRKNITSFNFCKFSLATEFLLFSHFAKGSNTKIDTSLLILISKTKTKTHNKKRNLEMVLASLSKNIFDKYLVKRKTYYNSLYVCTNEI